MKRIEKNQKVGFLDEDFFQVLFTRLFTRDVLFCVLSAVLLILSHPPFNLWFLAWIALVPLLFVLEGKSFWTSFRYGYVFGLCYFLGMFLWLIYVTKIGMLFLNMYLALYMGLFAATYSIFSKTKLGFKILLTAGAWVTWEFVRARFLSGFGWACLGHTQYTQTWLIQIAKLGGVFAVSFVLVVFNQMVYFFIKNWKRRKEKKAAFARVYFAFAMLLLSIYFYGFLEIMIGLQKPAQDPLRIAVIQQNISPDQKANPFMYETILERLTILTREAVKHKPDLIVWPEAAIPGLAQQIDISLRSVQGLAQEIHLPILLGYVRREHKRYYNTAEMFSARGERLQRYDKFFLVPFGEFTPFRKQIPFLSKVVPMEDISPGEHKTVFHIKKGEQDIKFSVLICFEDTLDYAARMFSDLGAELFINMTNDAWFRKTKAPWLHLQGAVFQAVGFERFLVRSTNTGVSAVITPYGKVQKILRDYTGQAIFSQGFEIFEVYAQQRQTFFARFGNIFAYLCIASLFLGVIINKIKIFKHIV